MKSFLDRLKRFKISIPQWGYGDEERLARIIYCTWTKLPLYDRRVLTAYWRNKNAVEELPLLTVELSACWSGRERGTVGQALLSGNIIRVLDGAFCRMPDDIAQVLFAHELMHILRDAQEVVEDDSDLEEELTREDVKTVWGYSEESLSDWLDANMDDIEHDLELQ